MRLPALRCIGFDLDGTLLESTRSLTLAMQRTRVELGLPSGDPGELASHIGWGLDTFLQRACADHPSLDLIAARSRFIAAYDDSLLEGVEPLPGAKSLLDGLSAAGVRPVLVTNKPSRWVPPLLTHLGWERHFDAVLTGDSHPWRKPDPRILLAAFGALEPSQVLFVGDSVVDAEAASGAECAFVQVRAPSPFGGGHAARLASAITVVESPHEFASWLGVNAG